MLDAFLDDGFLIPTFEQLAALQIEYEGRGSLMPWGSMFIGWEYQRWSGEHWVKGGNPSTLLAE